VNEIPAISFIRIGNSLIDDNNYLDFDDITNINYNNSSNNSNNSNINNKIIKKQASSVYHTLLQKKYYQIKNRFKL